MQEPPDSDLDILNEVERLVAELIAIGQWDDEHRWKIRPKVETIAFAARHNRRKEILSRLLSIIPRLDQSRRAPRLDREEVEQENKKEKRRHQRRELKAEVTVRSESGVLPGRTLDISESRMTVTLPVELPVGETVKLEMKLPTPATAHAIVRSRDVFRHGLEFVQPLREVVADETHLGDCQSCGGTGSILQPLDGEKGVAFARLECSDCSGTGYSSKQAV
jgi:hypothetical protein